MTIVTKKVLSAR